MASSNLTVLTQSHKAIAAKKRAKRDQIKEILFDEDARRDFLTGFHKRKLAKADAARKKAIEREKQERLEARREQRRMLRERAAENAAIVEEAYGALPEDEWTGLQDSPDKGKQKEAEYEDEEILATVTVVEDFDPDTFIHGPRVTNPTGASSSSQPPSVKSPHPPPVTKSKSAPMKKKSRPKKVRYETKEDRKVERSKQRARRTEKAELAGGKAARRKGTGNPRKNGGRNR
ncbi:hypothetical protein BD779DRAFT_1504532 [Infundibulicybe gibba]|nr:hypothetical protein BD779DRAFT_1504532 [Infundibulicybe gibba]